MYRELQPLRQALSQQVKADLSPARAGIDPDKLRETYLDRLTMYFGVDVADRTFTALALDAGQGILSSLEGCSSDPDGFQQFVSWALNSSVNFRRFAIVFPPSDRFYVN
jgi:hypothetical protein